jgi:hypothetical protein
VIRITRRITGRANARIAEIDQVSQRFEKLHDPESTAEASLCINLF